VDKAAMPANESDAGGNFPRFVGADGVWRQVLRRRDARHGDRALFLDRDGTIVEEIGYLSRPQDVRLVPGSAALIAAANRAGMPVIVVSNQSGIGRRLYGWDDFVAVQHRMLELLAAEGAAIDAVFACPHHADAEDQWRHADHPARKPNPLMLREAAGLLSIDLAQSWIVGDRATDLAAGRNAGLQGGLLVLSRTVDQPGELRAAQVLAAAGFRVFVTHSLEGVLKVVPLLERFAPTMS
jgi:D-glycero-D-manno-heptose 1,7-bisphosphate phosphatase